jgi:hypothetical protein
LPVVAGGGGDDAAPALRVREPRQQVDPAADLESTDWLVVLVLDPGLCPDQLIERRIAVQRGPVEGIG